jgi:3-phenylpropionate/trans-cinnamate dioxygenase ferredoxin subunit
MPSHEAVAVQVGPLAELPPGDAKKIETPAGPVAVFNIDGEVLAVADTCTHEDASLSQGYLEDNIIECLLHGAQFDLRTGEALSIPACIALRRFPVRVDGQIISVLV